MGMEQMMVCLLAEMKTNQAKMDAILMHPIHLVTRLQIQQNPSYSAPGSCVDGLRDTKFPVPKPSCFPIELEILVCATM
jgi:hypothetical protein